MPCGLILLAGPTASGKSRLALRLAEALDGVIVNADSMQVYRELRVITARPSAADEARAPHRLYGVISVAEAFSVAAWLARAEAEIAAVRAAGKTALVVGGTGLYLHALEHGLAPVPEVPAAVRAAARRRLAADGAQTLHAALAVRDPVMAARLDPGDGQRIARAWEVLAATGSSLAEWQSLPSTLPPAAAAARFVLMPPREWLFARCDARFARMVEGGAVQEVAALDALGPDPALPATKAVGVPELRRHVRGEIALGEAVEMGQRAVRRYAKRQLTWFRHRMAEWNHLSETDPDSVAHAILEGGCCALTAH